MSSTYYNPNKTPDFDITALSLPVYMCDYLVHESVMKGTTPFSIRNYSLALRTFLQWLILRENANMDAVEALSHITYVPLDSLRCLTSSDISSFIAYCRDIRGNGASACCTKLSVLKSFFEYSVNEAGILDNNPTVGVTFPKNIKKPVKIMTGREALSLIQACNCGETPARDVCIATFMLNCGLKISELTALNLADIKGNILRIWGKNGNNTRWLALNQDCMTALDFWKVERSMYDLNDNALFVSRRYGSRITERTVQQMLDKAFERAGLSEKGYTARNLRFTAGSLMYQSGAVDVPQLQTILGYKNSSFASRYSSYNGMSARKAMENFKISESGK